MLEKYVSIFSYISGAIAALWVAWTAHRGLSSWKEQPIIEAVTTLENRINSMQISLTILEMLINGKTIICIGIRWQQKKDQIASLNSQIKEVLNLMNNDVFKDYFPTVRRLEKYDPNIKFEDKLENLGSSIFRMTNLIILPYPVKNIERIQEDEDKVKYLLSDEFSELIATNQELAKELQNTLRNYVAKRQQSKLNRFWAWITKFTTS